MVVGGHKRVRCCDRMVPGPVEPSNLTSSGGVQEIAVDIVLEDLKCVNDGSKYGRLNRWHEN